MNRLNPPLIRRYGIIAVLSSFIPILTIAQPTNEVTLGFDGLPDLSLNVDDFGVHFTGAQVLACGGSLNCGPFPPFSGANVIYDGPGSGGLITATFDPDITGDVDKLSARITGNRNITMTAFDSQGTAVGTAQTGGANYVGSNTGIPANKLLEVISSSEPIVRVTFRDGGNTFTIDDFTFRSNRKTVVIDPGHGYILENGVPTYQRPPSPTYGLIEDQLTLMISGIVSAELQSKQIKVFLTRTSDAAPFAPSNCSVPCFADLNKRARWAEKQEADLLVSIHTNAGPPTGNGSESYWSTIAPSPDSANLAQNVLSEVVLLGLQNRGVKQENFNIINTSIPSCLIEVAFHSNSQLASGQAITDEARLNDPSFRAAVGKAIADGIQNYYETKNP